MASKMRQTRVVRRDEGEESDESVDTEALERLEALQRDRMAEMFGFDDEPQEKRPLKQKKTGKIAKPTSGKKLQNAKNPKQNPPGSGALTAGKVAHKSEKFGKKAVVKQ
eukprot:1259564-Rhodomonas_salina.1